MKIRMIQRRMMIVNARRKAESALSAKIYPALKSQGKSLERFLRKATLRKRLDKIGSNDDALLKVQTLIKEEGGGMGHKAWDDWKKVLIAILLLGLLNEADDLSDIENQTWESRGFPRLTFDPQQLVEDYQRRTGRNISDIADDTMKQIEEKISEWYVTDKPFSELMDSLEYLFSQSRADAIAATEIGDLMSQITFQAMLSYGWTEWFWDHKGEDIPCTNPITMVGRVYFGCKELNGNIFALGDPMPPSAAHPRCHCIATPIVPGE